MALNYCHDCDAPLICQRCEGKRPNAAKAELADDTATPQKEVMPDEPVRDGPASGDMNGAPTGGASTISDADFLLNVVDSLRVVADLEWPGMKRLRDIASRLAPQPLSVGIEFYRETDIDPPGPWQEVPSDDPRWSAEMEV